MNNCELCVKLGGESLWESPLCRVVLIDDPDYPGYCRVIWQEHVREMSDLRDVDRNYLMGIVFAVEAVLRELCSPDKINLASFGNMTPHVHWHVIPRWIDDPHFPQPVWGLRQREGKQASPKISSAYLAKRLAEVLNPISTSRADQ